MKTKKLLIFFGIILFIVYLVADKFSENKDIQIVVKLIGIIAAFPLVGKIIFDYFLSPKIKRNILHAVRQNSLLRLVTGIEIKDVSVTSSRSVQDKMKVLDSMGSKVSKLQNDITQESIFTIDFELQVEFQKGSGSFSDQQNWLPYIEQDIFQVILGESGFGKSYELLKRFSVYHQMLIEKKLDKTQMTNLRVPVFIELKSIEGDLSVESMFNYLTKKEQGRDLGLDPGHLKALMDKHQLVYFLDGLDEVEFDQRGVYYEEIKQLSFKTSVFFTCRKEIYTKLKNEHQSDYFSAEYNIVPLQEEKMLDIISRVPELKYAHKNELLEFVNQTSKRSDGDKLMEHLSVPLIFNLFIKVFHELTFEERESLKTGTQGNLLKILWQKYEDQAADRKISSNKNHPRILKYRTYTVWLAKINGKESFLIEKIQPDWLRVLDKEQNAVTSNWQKALYFFLTRILTSLFLGIAVGLIIATPFAFIGNSIIAGVLVTGLGALSKMALQKFGVPRGEEKWGLRKWIFIILFVLVMVLLLSFACGLYQGFSVPRGTEDMQTSNFSLAETFGGIVLSFVFSLIFSFRILIEYEKGQYILPVEKLDFNFKHAIAAGMIWGSLVGFVIGFLGLIVKHYFASSSFFSRWLNPYLQELILKVRGKAAPSVLDDVILFVFALLVAFSVAFLIIALLAGRRANTETSEDERKKKHINFGIRASAMYGAVHAFWITSTVAILYAILLLRLGKESLASGVSISLGIGIITFLWFGGIEVINHFILRLKLHIMGIAPFLYGTYFKYNQDMGFIKGSGAYLGFYHNTLSEYFAACKIKDNSRVIYKSPNRPLWLYVPLVILFILLVAQPFIKRYVTESYWKGPNELKVNSKDLEKDSDSTFKVLKTGKIISTLSGSLHLGTFTGFSGPRGVLTGFLGMPLKKAYNRTDAEYFRHAALLFRVKSSVGSWSEYFYLDPKLHSVEENYWQFLKKGDIIQFVVNDREWQNNSGHYNIEFRICEKCKN